MGWPRSRLAKLTIPAGLPHRLRALDQNIVDTHSDQIDADCVVLSHLRRQLQFRPYAICAGNEYRLPVAFRDFK